MNRKMTFILGACLFAAMTAVMPAHAQSIDDIDLIKSLGDKEKREQKAKEYKEKMQNQKRTTQKLTESQRRQLMMLEVMSGKSKLADRPPNVEIIAGPPLTSREKAYHVFNRMAYGARPGQIEDYASSGWDIYAREQLNPDKIDDSKAQTILRKHYPFSTFNIDQLQKMKANACDRYKMQGGCDRPGCESNKQFYRSVPAYIVASAALSKKQFAEVMYEFWRNHFSVDQHLQSKRMSYAVMDYEMNVIRKHAFGKFEDMLKASAQHPAMLEFLDNWISKKNNWNENYAREIMELHTLGADRYYNETDVLELTKVFTGWTFNAKSMNYNFRKDWHQDGNKRVLGVKIPQGEAGGERAIKMLAQHPGTAEFISWKLCRYLVNDNPPKDLVREITQVFKRTDGDLKKVYEAIIFSDEFMNQVHYRAKFKTPFEFTVSALRVTDADIESCVKTANHLAGMGQSIYNCPDPTGYYDQAEAWLDSGVLIRRWDYSWKFVRGSVDGVSIGDKFMEPYKSLSGEKLKQKMIADLVGADVGDATGKMFSEVAESGDRERLLSLILGSPAFQQQ